MSQSTSGIKHLLVVGGTGFIGQWVVKEGVNQGYQVSVLSRSTPSELNKIKGVTYHKVDIINKEKLACSIHQMKITHVVNLGGDINHASYRQGGRSVVNTHLLGVLNLVEVLDWEFIESFVQIGSSDEYGSAAAPQNETQKCEPISSYSYAKLAANEFLQMLNRTEQFPIVILRLFLVYGPGQNTERFLPQIITSCIHNMKFPTSKGEQIRDFCYIDDVVNGIFLALKSQDCSGQIFNIASGVPISIRSIIDTVVNMVGSGVAQYGKVQYRIGENMSLYADIKKSEKLLSWEPTLSLEQGIEKTIDYYRGK